MADVIQIETLGPKELLIAHIEKARATMAVLEEKRLEAHLAEAEWQNEINEVSRRIEEYSMAIRKLSI